MDILFKLEGLTAQNAPQIAEVMAFPANEDVYHGVCNGTQQKLYSGWEEECWQANNSTIIIGLSTKNFLKSSGSVKIHNSTACTQISTRGQYTGSRGLTSCSSRRKRCIKPIIYCRNWRYGVILTKFRTFMVNGARNFFIRGGCYILVIDMYS